MAEISLEEFTNSNNAGRKQVSTGTQVGFLSLKNDGDEAIVRIMHDSVDSIKIYTTHNITVDGKFRTTNCLRTATEPIDKCPLCREGVEVSNKIYLKVIEYVKNERGEIVPVPKIWTRSASYGKKIKSLIDEYGPLSDCVFKIKRSGAAGYLQTTYDVLYCNPNVYRGDLYPKLDNLFDGYSVLGRATLDKSADELEEFIATGSFPTVEHTPTSSASVDTFSSPTYKEDNTSIPFDVSPQTSVTRPVRRY